MGCRADHEPEGVVYLRAGSDPANGGRPATRSGDQPGLGRPLPRLDAVHRLYGEQARDRRSDARHGEGFDAARYPRIRNTKDILARSLRYCQAGSGP